MVFEHLFPEKVLESREWTGFFLAFIYSTLAIIIARLLFPANSGLVSVVFVSIFLLPYFEIILKREELQEKHEKHHTFWHLFYDNLDVIRTYFFLFFGIYLAFMLYTFFSPYFGYDVSAVFREQLSLESVRGGATFGFSTFMDIFLNNWWVLLACFVVSLIAGDGAIFFIAWNASTWGTIFGYRALAASVHTGDSALVALLVIVFITLPHVILEGGAYILAAIAGGVLSDAVDKASEVRKFVLYFISAVMLYVVLYLVAAVLFNGPLLGAIMIVGALVLLYAMQYVFEDAGDSFIFKYNFQLFLFAIFVFLVGAFVETLVLYNATPLQEVYMAAFG